MGSFGAEMALPSSPPGDEGVGLYTLTHHVVSHWIKGAPGSGEDLG